MKEVVLDASVVARFWMNDPDVPLASRAAGLRESHGRSELEIHVPDLLDLEVTNVFWKLTRFSGWPIAAALAAVSQLEEMDMVRHPSRESSLEHVLDLAVKHGVTVYDAIYVCLAADLELPMITADERLVHKVGPSFPFVTSLG